MNILGLIPARGGSKGVPGKNIRLLSNIPLVAYTLQAAKEATLIHETIISSDSEEIIAIAKKYGIHAPFVRPAALAEDDTPMLDVIQHVLNFFKLQKKFFDAVCLLQPTYPFRLPGFIDACIQKFTDANADTLISVAPVPHQYNPHWVFEKNNEGWLQVATKDETIVTRRQDLLEAFIRDGNVYVISSEVIMKHHTVFGRKIDYFLSDAYWYVNIDSEDDWSIAETKAEEYLRKLMFE